MNRLTRHARSLIAGAGALTLGFGLSACGGESDGDNVVLTMAMMNTYQGGFEELIAEFEEENPGIVIEPSYYSADTYDHTVPTQFSGGSGSDLVYVDAGSGTQSVKRMGGAGWLADLSDQPWVDTLYPATADGYQIDGKTYGRDFGISALAVLLYDKDYFAEKGLTPPETFETLLEMCGTISADGKTPISMAGGSGAVDFNDVVSMAGNTVLGPEQDWLDRRYAGEVTFAGTAGWEEALGQLQQLNEAGCFSPGVASINLDQMLTDMGSRQATMMFTYGGLIAPVLQQTPDLNVGMFSPPAPAGSETWLTAQASGGIAVWSKSKHPDEARRFVVFVSQEDKLRQLASTNVLISPIDAATGDLPEAYAELAPYFEADKVISAMVTSLPDSTKVTDDSGAAIQGLWTGQSDIPAILAAFDRSFDEAAEKANE
jgi:raffinose/stachyose/melibiose transport system substrate-binding protein